MWRRDGGGSSSPHVRGGKAPGPVKGPASSGFRSSSQAGNTRSSRVRTLGSMGSSPGRRRCSRQDRSRWRLGPGPNRRRPCPSQGSTEQQSSSWDHPFKVDGDTARFAGAEISYMNQFDPARTPRQSRVACPAPFSYPSQRGSWDGGGTLQPPDAKAREPLHRDRRLVRRCRGCFRLKREPPVCPGLRPGFGLGLGLGFRGSAVAFGRKAVIAAAQQAHPRGALGQTMAIR